MATAPISKDPNLPEAQAARKARYTELRKKLGRSKLEVRGKKGTHYFWADGVRDQGEIIRLSSVGYSITREPNAKDVLAGKAKPEIEANGLCEDGTYKIGDVLLMQCPEEVYEFLELDKSERHEDMVRGVSETFKANAEELGVPTFEPRTKK
jgi:hypothetical protein